eukprot:TRINITY_DN10987_c0_g1_i1.p1 TRINITY_DN10987_c0_g1~~TRINITY_DN10987_c0_g1_i1.p1  ORF type:complete len:398 (-),score=72.44 TRINITY_DN10987_c0_g1_i1:505-1698(-)
MDPRSLSFLVVSFVLVLSLVQYAFCAPLASFSGTFSRDRTTAAPNFSGGTCSTLSTTSYAVFNYTFPTTGIRLVSSVNINQLYVYVNNANIANLCQNYPWKLESNAPFVGTGWTDAFYFLQNVKYVFVVLGTAPSSGQTGAFAVQIDDGMVQGSVSAANQWAPLYTWNQNECTKDGNQGFYGTYRYTPPTTRFYDITIAFDYNEDNTNNPRPNFIYISIVTGTSIPSSCSTGTFVVGIKTTNSRRITVIQDQALTAGQTYTVIATAMTTISANPYTGHYTVIVSPSPRYSYGSTAGFVRPVGCGATCSTGTGAPQTYTTAVVTVIPNTYFFLYGYNYENYGYMDYFIYAGTNNPVTPCGSSPSSGQCVSEKDTRLQSFFLATTNTYTSKSTSRRYTS